MHIQQSRLRTHRQIHPDEFGCRSETGKRKIYSIFIESHKENHRRSQMAVLKIRGHRSNSKYLRYDLFQDFIFQRAACVMSLMTLPLTLSFPAVVRYSLRIKSKYYRR